MSGTRVRTPGAAAVTSALVLSVLLSAAAVGPAVAAPGPAARVADADPPRPCPTEPTRLDQVLLDCLVDQARASGDSGTAVFRAPAAMPADRFRPEQLRDAADAFGDGRLTVVLPAGDSGQGGALLLVLASGRDRRLVSPEASVADLDAETAAALGRIGRCDQGSLCARLDKGAVAGSDLIRDGQALDGNTRTAPVVRGRGTGSDTPLWLLVGFTAALLLALALAFPYARRYAAARGGRAEGAAHPAPPAPPPPPAVPPAGGSARAARRIPRPGGQVRPAVVRSRLHPQGYVELHHCLVRATWADAADPPPVGEPVDTVADESGALWAVPPSRGTGTSTRSTMGNPRGPHGR
jgi:hypothetical protein